MLPRFLAPIPLVIALAAPAVAQRPAEAPRRVVLIVADGAGLAHWSAARATGHELALDAFPVVGLVDPAPVGAREPESAASATAFATGVRTVRRAIGVGPDSTPRRTVLEAAERAGMATGLVTTSEVFDATPAAFAAHVVNRDLAQEIAAQIAASGVDVLMGDGEWAFGPELRADRRDLLGALARDHVVVRDAAGLDRARAAPPEKLIGFFDIDSIMDPDRRSPRLEAMARTALAVLDRAPRGFFLLVESEHTDHQSHHGVPLPVIVEEIVEVDRAVRAALEYRRRRPGTLVVVTGDHETGGLTVIPDGRGFRAQWSSTEHTAAMVPIFAVGPGAERFAGLHTAAEVGRALFAAIGQPVPPPANER